MCVNLEGSYMCSCPPGYASQGGHCASEYNVIEVQQTSHTFCSNPILIVFADCVVTGVLHECNDNVSTYTTLTLAEQRSDDFMYYTRNGFNVTVAVLVAPLHIVIKSRCNSVLASVIFTISFDFKYTFLLLRILVNITVY